MNMWNSGDYRNQGEAMLVLGLLSPTPTPPPSPVDDLAAATIDDASIGLTFTPVIGATSYEYRIDGGSWVACTDTSGMQIVGGLSANTAYSFEVRGHNTGGYSSASNTANATTFTSEAVALFARMTTPPVSARAILINTCIASLIATEVWTKLECLWLPAAADAQAARLNWISSNFNLTASGSPAFTTDRGYAGNGSTSYLDTGFTLSNGTLFTQNSGSMICWLNAGTTTTGGIAMGASITTGTLGSVLAPHNTGDVIRGRVNSGSNTNLAASTTRLGFSGIRRSSATSIAAVRDNGTPTVAAVTSTGVPTNTVFLGGEHAASTLSSPIDNRFAAAGVGASLTDTDFSNLYSTLNTFLTAIGAN